MKKLVDRNPHTGAKMQTKETTDAYRDNYDAIFRKDRTPDLTPFPSFGDFLKLSKDAGMDEHCFNGDDGSGYYATEKGYSEKHPFGRVRRPAWATHFLWFNK